MVIHKRKRLITAALGIVLIILAIRMIGTTSFSLLKEDIESIMLKSYSIHGDTEVRIDEKNYGRVVRYLNTLRVSEFDGMPASLELISTKDSNRKIFIDLKQPNEKGVKQYIVTIYHSKDWVILLGTIRVFAKIEVVKADGSTLNWEYTYLQTRLLTNLFNKLWESQ